VWLCYAIIVVEWTYLLGDLKYLYTLVIW
jgi:hypothetical protein